MNAVEQNVTSIMQNTQVILNIFTLQMKKLAPYGTGGRLLLTADL